MNHHSQGDASAQQERPYVPGVSLRRANVSSCLTDGSPGSGPKVRKHPDAEVFVVWEGDVTFAAGDDIVEATSGQIVVVPAVCLASSSTPAPDGPGTSTSTPARA